MRILHMYLVFSVSLHIRTPFCILILLFCCYGLHTLHSHNHVFSNILYCYSYSSGFSPMESFFPLPFQGFYFPWVFPWSVQGHHRPKSVVFVVYSHFGHVFHQLLLVLVLQVSYNFESILVLSDTLLYHCTLDPASWCTCAALSCISSFLWISCLW